MMMMPSIVLLLLLLFLTSYVLVSGEEKLLDPSSSSSSAEAAAATAATATTPDDESQRRLQQQQQLRRRRRTETEAETETEAIEIEIDDEPDQKQHYSNVEETKMKTKLNRIIGGQDVQPTNKYPWFARVIGSTLDDSGSSGIDACGGSLIAPDLVLTAAHCSEPIKVYLNVYDLDNKPDNGINVIANVRHPLYGTGNYSIDYDIMISQLETPVTDIDIEPIRLNFDNNYPNDEIDNGLDLTMIGFGSIIGGVETNQENPPIQSSRILQSANTNYVPFDICSIATDPDTGVVYGVGPKRTAVKENWFCTLDDITSTCFGDSGGPIIKENYFDLSKTTNNNQDINNNNNKYNDLLLAVISGTSGYCGNPHLPLWNSRVSFHKEWILYWGCNLSDGNSNTAPKEWNCIPTPSGIDGNSTNNVPIDNNVYYLVDDLENDLDTNGDIITDDTDAPTITTITTTVVPTSIQITPTDAPIAVVTQEATNEPTTDNPSSLESEPPIIIMTSAPTLLMTSRTTSEPTTTTPPITIAPIDALTLSPTVSPTTISPTSTPTNTPTPKEPTLIITLPPTLKPNPFPIPSPTTELESSEDSAMFPPQDEESSDDNSEDDNEEDDENDNEDDDDELFVCHICGDDELMISNPNAIVFVPVLGQKTCAELETAAIEGRIDEGGECDSIQITVPSVCDCIIPTILKQPIPIITEVVVPTLKPTTLPNPAPPPTIPTCDAIKNKDDLNNIDITIDFYFDNSSAQYVGWYITDPNEECFRIGTPSGNYFGRTKVESLSLIENVEYKFVLEVNENDGTDDDEVISGSYNITAGDYLLVSSSGNNGIFNDGDTTIFTTPQL